MMQSNTKKSAKSLLLIFIIFTLLLSIGGNLLYRYQKKNITIEQHDQLASISKLKVDQISNWRKEQIDNAREIYNNQAITTLTTWLFIITFLLILIAALVIYFIWKKQANQEIIINHQHLQTLVDEQTVYLKDFNQQLENDLEERKVIEEKLRESEQRLSFHFENSPLAVVEWDADFNVTQWSKEAEHIFGWKATETMGKPIGSLNMIYEDDIPIVEDTMERLVGGIENVVISTNRNHTKRGEIIECTWYNTIFNDAEGKMTSVMSLIEDITQRKLNEAELLKAKGDLEIRVLERTIELAKSEERFRTTLDNLMEGCMFIGHDWTFLYVNDTATKQLNKRREELVGHTMMQIYPERSFMPALNKFQESLLQRKQNHFIEELKFADGNVKWFDFRVEPVSEGIFIMSEDITVRILAEKEIINLNEELENRVIERTTQLQAANKELEAFSYSVSHDLRAPLRSIDGWSMALLEDCANLLDKQGLEYLDRVRSETQRMGHLIDDLLKLSRVSRAEFKKEDVDLSTLALDIKKRLLKSATERQIEFIIQPGMFTLGDPRMLEIALTNLLDNAYKFTGKQPVALIEFGQSMIDDKQTYWVRDNGVGFDMTNAKNLFGAFQRMHRQSDFPGTGVGLATVQRIIHRHEGLIWAESKINEGATFYFTLT